MIVQYRLIFTRKYWTLKFLHYFQLGGESALNVSSRFHVHDCNENPKMFCAILFHFQGSCWPIADDASSIIIWIVTLEAQTRIRHKEYCFKSQKTRSKLARFIYPKKKYWQLTSNFGHPLAWIPCEIVLKQRNEVTPQNERALKINHFFFAIQNCDYCELYVLGAAIPQDSWHSDSTLWDWARKTRRNTAN